MNKGKIIFIIGLLGMVYANFSPNFWFYFVLGIVVSICGGILIDKGKIKQEAKMEETQKEEKKEDIEEIVDED